MYWNPLSASPTRLAQSRLYAEKLAELVDSATKERLEGAQTVGCHLTAGLDSSTVACAAARELSRHHRTLHCFTAVPGECFEGTALAWGLADEGPASADVARLYPNIDHTLVSAQGRDVMADVERMVAHSSEPVRNAINISWMLAILDRARLCGVDRMLTGQLGNATISYEGTLALRDLFRTGRWARLGASAFALRYHHELSCKQVLQTAFDGLLPAGLKRRLLPSFVRQQERGLSVLHPDLVARHRLEERAEEAYYNDLHDSRTERQWMLGNTDLSGHYTALEALSGIATLDPTGDRRIFEFCFSIPIEQFIVGGRSRSLIRRAMRGRLPQSTLERHERGHQGADWHGVLTACLPSLRAEFTQIERSPAAQYFLNLPYLRGLLDAWPMTGYDSVRGVQTWKVNLTKGLSMGHFLRTHEGSLG